MSTDRSDMSHLGDPAIDLVVAKGTMLDEAVRVVTVVPDREPDKDESSEAWGVGRAATEPGPTPQRVGGFDRWPGGLTG